jgi:S1-C subfamily serine protease
MRLLLILAMFAAFPCSLLAEDLPQPKIEDPFGLGERLALIDYLRDTCKLSPPPDATMEHLVAMYWKHHRKEREAIHEDATDVALSADRVRRLRSELKERYQIDAPADADETALGKLVAEARSKATGEAVKQVLDKAAARDNPTSPQEAARFAARDRESSQVRLDSIAQDERAVRAESQQVDEQRRALVRQTQEMQTVLGTLRDTYNEQVTKHNHLVNLYEKQTQEGSSDALRTLEQIHDQRKVIDQAKGAVDQQEAAIAGLTSKDEALLARRKRLDEAIASIAQRRAAEQNPAAGDAVASAPGPSTPGGVAEAPAVGSLQAKLVAGVVLLVVKDIGTGTGFLVSRDGLVVTNAHVLRNRNATVMAMWDASANRRTVRMKVIDFSEADDLALLQAVDGAPFEPLPLTEVYELQRPLLSAGFPLAGSIANSLQTSPSDIVLSRGILGSVRRAEGRVEWLQHDCRVASGNSGGPVIDQQTGAVIGVTTKVLKTDGVNSHGDGINLAIPIRKVMDRFAAHLKP